MKQLLLDIAAPALPTLDNFVAGSNAELLLALRDMLSAASGERFIYLWGDVGCGRSHLLRAVVQAAGRAAYLSGADHPQFERAEAGLVAVDDVHLLDDAEQVALFNLYNALREEGGMLLASGAAPPPQLPLRPDLVTRLSWGLVYRVHGLSDAEKAQALQRHAQSRSFELPREVADYLLRHGPRDLPALMAMLDALDRYTLETKRTITLPLLRDFMAE